MFLNYFKTVRRDIFWLLVVCVVAAAPLGAQADGPKKDSNVANSAELAKAAGTPTQSSAAVFQDRLFGMVSFRLPDTARLPKWTGVVQRHASEGKSATPALSDWHRFVAALKGQDKRTQLEEINRYVNRVRYVSDEANYGRLDYWATPAELFARGGDCEDYAITKFLALRSLGFTNEEMRLVAVQDIKRRIPHAVLVVDIGGETLTLDNLIWKVVPTNWIDHYRPLYSVNIGNMWIHRS